METELGKIIAEKYEILKLIGQGGMSYVYLALDKQHNKPWAVKVIKNTSDGETSKLVFNSLLTEAKLMSKLNHAALPTIKEIIEDGEKVYIVMEYIEGKSLDKYIKEYGTQSEEKVVEWAKQLCDVLGYLHSRRPAIIYRDMKPSNIMIEPDGKLRLIDFGIAREYKETNIADTTVLGTNGFAPPEQHGARQTDERSDIYALGMTLHYLLTGEDPRSTGYIYEPVRYWRPELSEKIERIIDKCTSLFPEERYQNCSELISDLERDVLDNDEVNTVNPAFVNVAYEDTVTTTNSDKDDEVKVSQNEHINKNETDTKLKNKGKKKTIIVVIVIAIAVILLVSIIAKTVEENRRRNIELEKQEKINEIQNEIDDIYDELYDYDDSSDEEYWEDEEYWSDEEDSDEEEYWDEEEYYSDEEY